MSLTVAIIFQPVGETLQSFVASKSILRNLALITNRDSTNL